MEVEDGDRGAAAQTTDQASTPAPTITSALKPNTTPKISIDQAALNRIMNTDEVTPQYNVRPRNTGIRRNFYNLSSIIATMKGITRRYPSSPASRK